MVRFTRATQIAFLLQGRRPIIRTFSALRRAHRLGASSIIQNEHDNDDHDDPPPLVQLRNATMDDVHLLQGWDEQEHLQGYDVMGDEDFNDWDWPQSLAEDYPWKRQLVAETTSQNIPIGFVLVIDPANEITHYWGNDCEPHLRAVDMWIGEPDYLGKGYGTEIMTQVLNDYVFHEPSVVAALVDPMAGNTRAHRFYQKRGFKPIGIRHFGPDCCLVHRLNRTDWIKRNKSSSS